MELSSWTLYWITRFDALGVALRVAAFAAAGWAVVAFIFLMVSSEEKDKEGIRICTRALRNSLLACGTALTLCALTPTTKEACAILVVPQIINNEDVRGVSQDALDAASAWLKSVTPVTEETK